MIALFFKRQRSSVALLVLATLFGSRLAWADDALMQKPSPNDQSPSKDQVLWTDTHLAYDFESDYSYTGRTSTSFGGGRPNGDVSGYDSHMSHTFTTRGLLAFLFQGGVEWEHRGFGAPKEVPVPNELDSVDIPLIMDFRWSSKDLMRVQAAPGYYSDGAIFDGNTFNAPVTLAYTRIPSRNLQFGIGLSYNGQRNSHFLGGGGFRWQIDDRWKLKFLLPRPQIEYKVADPLHVWVGSDFEGDTYRTSATFGTDHGDPRLNRALVDYQDVRVGSGFSWNIRPLWEINGEFGYMLSQSFNYHTSSLRSTSGKAPYAMINLKFLFQLSKDNRSIPKQISDLSNDYPWTRRYIGSQGEGAPTLSF